MLICSETSLTLTVAYVVFRRLVFNAQQADTGPTSLLQRAQAKTCHQLQGVVTPDGIVVDLFGPDLGARDDVHLLNESGVLLTLAQHMKSPSGDPYLLYGDPAYGMSTHLNCPYSAETFGPLTAGMLEFNKQMSACRVTVEWVFKEMTSKWAFVSMKNQQRYLLSPVGVQYKVATLLSNIHSCLNGGNEISQFFACPPTSL